MTHWDGKLRRRVPVKYALHRDNSTGAGSCSVIPRLMNIGASFHDRDIIPGPLVNTVMAAVDATPKSKSKRRKRQ